MTPRFAGLTAFFDRRSTWIVLAFATLAALISLAYYYATDGILAYGDAESHVNIAKRVTGGLTPGFGQLGGVWLPLHHMMMAPFLTSDFMWRTGLGGSVVSSICYVGAVYYVYRLAQLLFSPKRIPVVAATLVFAMNPNTLYMLATPMSELPLLFFLISSTYFFVRWMLTEDVRFVIISAGLSFAGVLIRYDAWFLVFVQVLAVLAIGLHRKWRFAKIEGTTFVFALPAALGGALWLLWCQLIFGDPFYFLNSQYSARSQQEHFAAKGELPTQHDVGESFVYYGQAVIENSSVLLVFFALIGGIVFLLRDANTRRKSFDSAVIASLLVSPLVFNVLSLFLGISILFIPVLTPDHFDFQLFNIRYGMMMLPAIAIFIGALVSRLSTNTFMRLEVLAILAFVVGFGFSRPITLADGTWGLSARKPGTKVTIIEQAFNDNYDYGYVAFDDFGRSASPIDLNVPFEKIIYVGNHPHWDNLLVEPHKYARFLIMREHDELWEKSLENPGFLDNYKLVTAGENVVLYKCATNCVGDVDISTQISLE